MIGASVGDGGRPEELGIAQGRAAIRTPGVQTQMSRWMANASWEELVLPFPNVCNLLLHGALWLFQAFFLIS